MLAAALNTAYVLVSSFALFLLPGFLIARRFLAPVAATPTELLAVTAASAALLVPTLYFFVGVFTSIPLQLALILAVAVPLCAALWFGHRPNVTAGPVWRTTRADWLPALAVSALAFAGQLLFFDTVEEFNTMCTYSPVSVAMAERSAIRYGEVLFWSGHQRMGVTAILAPATALWGVLGIRIAWGLMFAALSLSVYVSARRLGANHGSALFGALVAGLLPAIALDADQNRLVLALVAFAVLLFALRSNRGFLLGAVMALALGAEPTLVVTAPAVLLALLGRPDAALRAPGYHRGLLGGFFLMAAPFLLRYALAFDGFVLHENFTYVAPQEYSLLGLRFETRAFFGWPLHDELVRSPYNPLPNLALVPVVIQSHFGVFLAGLAGLGAVTTGRRQPRHVFLALALFFLAITVFLGLNENWTQKDKWAIATIGYLPLLLWIPVGLTALRGRGRELSLALLTFLVFAGATAGGRVFIARVDAPEDSRNRVFVEAALSVPPLPAEPSNYLALERRWAGRVAWLPEGWPWLRMGIGWGTRVRALGREVRRLALDDREHSALEGAIAWTLHDPAMRPHGWPARLRRRVAGAHAQTAPPRFMFDVALPPDAGLDIATGTSLRPTTCDDPEYAWPLYPFAPPVRVRVPWADAPIVVALGESDLRPTASVWIGRSTAGNLADYLESLSIVDTTCLALHFEGPRELLVFDVLAMDPARIYVYSAEAIEGGLQMTLREY